MKYLYFFHIEIYVTQKKFQYCNVSFYFPNILQPNCKYIKADQEVVGEREGNEKAKAGGGRN